jgi:hypothetical protein
MATTTRRITRDCAEEVRNDLLVNHDIDDFDLVDNDEWIG